MFFLTVGQKSGKITIMEIDVQGKPENHSFFVSFRMIILIESCAHLDDKR